MKISSLVSIVLDAILSGSVRHKYWALSLFAKEVKTIFSHSDTNLRRLILNDFKRYVLGVKPALGFTKERIDAAVAWLLNAQAATPDDGVSLGYFPADGIYAGWRPSYPETTGYIITSLLRYAQEFGDARVREAAIRMGHWEISVQMLSGAVQGGPVTSPDKQTPAAFNTGMVLDGWCSAYEVTQDGAFLSAGMKAADFLANDLDDRGYFKTNGDYVSAGEIKTYTCLCAWAMYRFGVLASTPAYCEAAVRSIEAAIKQQQSNGWFAHSCLTRSDAPLTHTIGYTLQSILEVGLLAQREDFIESVKQGIAPILDRIKPNGYLSGRFYANWESACFSSCLTGSAQIAIVAYRLAEHTGNDEYRQKADQLVNFLKSMQQLESTSPALIGCIAGSFPSTGDYMRSGYPNWATKYYLDALMLQLKHS